MLFQLPFDCVILTLECNDLSVFFEHLLNVEYSREMEDSYGLVISQ